MVSSTPTTKILDSTKAMETAHVVSTKERPLHTCSHAMMIKKKGNCNDLQIALCDALTKIETPKTYPTVYTIWSDYI